MKLLKDLLDQMKGYILPRSASERTAPSYDGQYDPLGDEELLTIEKRGSFNKDTTGKLYYPTTDGYLRQLYFRVLLDKQPVKVTTTDDTAVALGIAGNIGLFAMSAYQNSGGARTLYIGNAAKTIILYSQSIPDVTLTLLSINTMELPLYTYAWWSAAAGAEQYVNTVRKSATHSSINSTFSYV